MNEKGNSSFYYGWIIVVVATLALVVSNGLSVGGIPVFYKPLREDFVTSGIVAAGQAESMIGMAGSLTFLIAGFFSPVAGYLIEKFNIKYLMIAGCAVLGAALLIHSQAMSPTAVYVSRSLMGVSLGLIGVLPGTVLVSHWFRRRRGTAIGIVLTGTSIGGVIIPLVAAPLIAAYGWRTAMIFVSLIVWFILLPAVVLLVKNRPADAGLLPDDESLQRINSNENKNHDEQKTIGLTLTQALKTPLFWIFASCAALIFYPIFVTTQQFILYLQTPRIGMSAQTASFAQSALFAVSVGGKFLFGFLSDKLSPTRVMLFCCAVMFAATFVLFGLTAANALLFLIPFGLGYGGTFVLLQRLTADYFGLKEYAKILGAITVVETVGAAIGGNITGRLADAAGGDYTKAFYGVVITTGFAFLLVIILNFLPKPNLEKA